MTVDLGQTTVLCPQCAVPLRVRFEGLPGTDAVRVQVAEHDCPRWTAKEQAA